MFGIISNYKNLFVADFSTREEKIIKVFANIAKPVLEIEKQESFKITNENSKASYLFEVRNYNEKEISEVEMEYYIEIIKCIYLMILIHLL